MYKMTTSQPKNKKKGREEEEGDFVTSFSREDWRRREVRLKEKKREMKMRVFNVYLSLQGGKDSEKVEKGDCPVVIVNEKKTNIHKQTTQSSMRNWLSKPEGGLSLPLNILGKKNKNRERDKKE